MHKTIGDELESLAWSEPEDGERVVLLSDVKELVAKRLSMNLNRIDLSKADKHEHLDIVKGEWYLARIDGHWLAGQFLREWYGWNFMPYCCAQSGFQFDAPGWNASRWQELFLMESV